ncbi:hypothetical protein A2U01_0112629, partial [Trifolium medium]|nr:hypothetical protein [Trifolium medium]
MIPWILVCKSVKLVLSQTCKDISFDVEVDW